MDATFKPTRVDICPCNIDIHFIHVAHVFMAAFGINAQYTLSLNILIRPTIIMLFLLAFNLCRNSACAGYVSHTRLPGTVRNAYPTLLSCLKLITLFFSLSGCAQYQSQPLTKDAIEQQLQTPDIQQLTIRATEIKHPLLKPVAFNLRDGLSPDEAAVVAVLLNPHLRVARDQHNIANAQLLKAGLLPDPQLSYTFAAPSGGTDLGMNNAFGVGLN